MKVKAECHCLNCGQVWNSFYTKISAKEYYFDTATCPRCDYHRFSCSPDLSSETKLTQSGSQVVETKG